MKAVQIYSEIVGSNLKGNILERYLLTKQGKTAKDYRKNISNFFKWVKNNHERINIESLACYKLFLEAKDLKPTTVNTYIAPLKDFFQWACDMGYIEINPAKHLRLKRIDQTKDKARALNPQELKELFKATSKDTPVLHSERLMLLMVFNLGLRASEVAGAKMEHINLDKSTIEVLGKGNKTRILGINEVLLKELLDFIKRYPSKLFDHDYLIQTGYHDKQKKPASIQHINRVIKRTAQRAGLDPEGIKSHTGRVTAINYLLDNEVPMRDVANFAGHSNINTTREYDRKDQAKVIQTCNIISFSENE